MSAGDEARKKLLRKKKIEKAMEAAFDNDLANFRKILEDARDGIDVPLEPSANAANKKEDSFLGEAACGNAVDVVRYCLGKGATVNSIGQQSRTPLQRALLNDSLDVVPLLLEAGADIRLLFPQERDAATGEITAYRQYDASEIDGLECSEEAKKILRAWDFAKTLALLQANGALQAAAATAKHEAEVLAQVQFQSKSDKLREQLVEARAAYKTALERREQRIVEYDTQKCAGNTHGLATLDTLIQESMSEVEQISMRIAQLEHDLRHSEAKLREHEVSMKGGIQYNTEIGIGMLEDVIFADVGGSMAKSGKKIPLVVDPSGNALTFLTYRSALLVDVANSHHMHPKQMILNVLGCLRFGKPFVVNFRDKPLADTVAVFQAKCEAAHPGLFKALMDKSVKEPSFFSKMITPEVEKENGELSVRTFTPTFTEKFTMTIITNQPFPEEAAMEPFYTVHVTQ
jgi:hypothetical protein